MKIKAANDYLIVKLFKKIQTNSGIILPDAGLPDSKLKSDWVYEPIGEVYSAGPKCEHLKDGDRIVLTKPHFILINPVMKEIDKKTGEKYDYIKAKEEDVLAIIK
jgi:co-chaperonin GroES (HSP10)